MKGMDTVRFKETTRVHDWDWTSERHNYDSPTGAKPTFLQLRKDDEEPAINPYAHYMGLKIIEVIEGFMFVVMKAINTRKCRSEDDERWLLLNTVFGD
ncbi:unnamed protein product [Vicia faba]|uniref:Uncharacterized protein n=1 Tax=Vicia faba TaxID=3906 RepID=A0AAV0YQV6_VICFA|nr:unnamed protein product [Vicia faba]